MHTVTIFRQGDSDVIRRRKFSLTQLKPEVGKPQVFDRPSVTVGSAESNDFVIDDPAVSRYHLRIEHCERGFLVTDLDSKNSTRISGLLVHKAVVRAATDLKLGKTTIRIEPLESHAEVPLPNVFNFGRLVGKSAAMRELFSLLAKVAPLEGPVLIEGETGTGKTVIGEEIHRHSVRADGPFVVVDCSAIAENLFTSDLFGHVKGAFTGADQERIGAFRQADGGTLFLDEIGELPLELQPQLLRVLEQGQVKPVGGNEYHAVDVRVVAATNRDLMCEVNRGTFRSDLYYRIAGFQIQAPPLRDRPEDVEILAKQLIESFAGDYGLGTRELSAEQLRQLSGQRWPGNVRELRNAIERMVVLAELDMPSGGPAPAPAATPADESDGEVPKIARLAGLDFKSAKREWVDYFEVHYIRRLLAQASNNVAEASRISQMGRVHLFRLLKKHGIRRE